MDMELSQLDSIYLHNLTKYHKILQQRNKLLKDIHYRAGSGSDASDLG